jgi:hypothetical protein
MEPGGFKLRVNCKLRVNYIFSLYTAPPMCARMRFREFICLRPLLCPAL